MALGVLRKRPANHYRLEYRQAGIRKASYGGATIDG